MIELYILLILMIVGAVLALEVKDLLSSVIIIGAVGFCLSAAFLLLKAPDLAMTQLIVEIVLVIILVRATIYTDSRVHRTKRNYGIFVCVLISIVLFLGSAAYVIAKLPIFGKPLMRISRAYLSEAFYASNSGNVVAAITLDYRIFDTFVALVALFTAVIAIMTLSRKKKNQIEKLNITEPQPEQGMSIIVKTVTRLTVGVLFLYGINVALHGHIIPGGGFAGGAIIALSLLNLVLAFGKDAALDKLSHKWAIIFTTLGLMLFMLIGLFGRRDNQILETLFYDKAGILKIFSIGNIPLLNIALCLQVGAGIFAIFIYLVSIEQEADNK